MGSCKTDKLYINVFKAKNGTMPPRYRWFYFGYDITKATQEHIYGSVVIIEQGLASISKIRRTQVSSPRWRSREIILDLKLVVDACPWVLHRAELLELALPSPAL